jgi:divalent metal cation (Fe/Co/Zn/Cd) transporter
MTFAFFLARENKGLLIGEGITKSDYRKIVERVLTIPEVNRIVSVRSMHFAPQDVLVAMEVNLKDGLETDKIELVIDKIEQQIRQVLPYINPSKIYIELEQDSCKVDFTKSKSGKTDESLPS